MFTSGGSKSVEPRLNNEYAQRYYHDTFPTGLVSSARRYCVGRVLLSSQLKRLALSSSITIPFFHFDAI